MRVILEILGTRMAKGDDLKQAVVSIRNAIISMRQEVESIRAEILKKELKMRQKVDELQVRKRRDDAVMANTATRNDERADLVREEAGIGAEIARLEHEFRQEKDKLSQQISEKELQERKLEEMAKDIEKRAAGFWPNY